MSETESSENVTAAGVDAAGDDGAALRKERDELYDRLLRTAAEFDNYRKRTVRERSEWSEAAVADVLREWLPVIDDLDRALAARPEPVERARPDAVESQAAESYWRGVELIQRRALDLLRKRGVEPFDAIGLDFDPTWHEAVASEPAAGHRDGEITAEMSRGYRIGQRLLRPAQVKVARA
jgi:molecular chaperone GrpE